MSWTLTRYLLVTLQTRPAGQSRSTTQSTHWVSALTSSGSTAGNIPTRSWLRPSLRYGSVSTMPLARSALAIAAASTSSEKSTVPTTCDRNSGSVTNGVANVDASAQEYTPSDASPLPFPHHSTP